MARWVDIFSLIITLSLVAAVVYGLTYVGKLSSQVANATKESLKTRGIEISGQGVSVKTNKRMDHDDYLDATQRGFVKAYNHSHFGRSISAQDIHEHSTESRDRHGTVSGATHSFGLKKTTSSH